jgi:hypothetical protein
VEVGVGITDGVAVGLAVGGGVTDGWGVRLGVGLGVGWLSSPPVVINKFGAV